MRNPKVLEKFFLTSTGEKLLQGAGPVSHDKAVEKATGEYRKYQQRTLSDVEISFLDSIDELKDKTALPENK